MTLIKSISGFRGTIGGTPGDNLTPIDIVQLTAAYGAWIQKRHAGNTIVIGRDARISGPMLSALVSNTLIGMGMDVIDLGLSTTPTVEVAVPELRAAGGIILTASHNPAQWNALKLLNEAGEFISAREGAELLAMVDSGSIEFATVNKLGRIMNDDSWIDRHIDLILSRPEIDADLISKRQFKVVVDAVNSTGGIAIPRLLNKLGVEAELMYCEPNGHFPHNPEPLAENLTEICDRVAKSGADMGIVVDPDVDRLCFVMENGVLFGEEYTLVAVADYLLGIRPGNTVSNLSSTRALRDITEKHGGTYRASAVGEVNVVQMMKETNAVIGGEGNGGVIWPDLHYGRDALAGIALFLTYLAQRNCSMTELKASYPNYVMSKDKLELGSLNLKELFRKVEAKFEGESMNRIDGLKIDFDRSWVHLRPSNTEPIVRIYSEAETMEEARRLTEMIKDLI
ncbi:MAG: phosphoglucosamine mutase [Flavobacteriales bacterium]|nr:phosphoglucosamine mutase [Flavobacteriales bacterium]